MKMENVLTTYQPETGALAGENVQWASKQLGEILSLFADDQVGKAMDPTTVVYQVCTHEVVPEGAPGGLFFGTSCIHPGKVGEEYFMTKGHFHSRREAAEYYWGISGTGVLLLLDEQGCCRAQAVEKGSLHYIGGYTAHRLVNTGETDLVVGACWPADAGHDYGIIGEGGFPLRVVCRDGKPVLVEQASGRKVEP